VTILRNFRTKQKQKNILATHNRCAYERMREIRRVIFACSFLLSLCMFMCCCWCVVCLTVTICFSVLVLFYFIDEKKSEMLVIKTYWSNQQLFYGCNVFTLMYYRYIIDSLIDASFWFIWLYTFRVIKDANFSICIAIISLKTEILWKVWTSAGRSCLLELICVDILT
jgi:hypothetical protein